MAYTGNNMKGRNPTAAEKVWLSSICDSGCIVCLEFLHIKTEASPHHIDGKTKKGAHFLTIPLCGRHHQIPGDGYTSRHGDGKARFEAAYGSELELLGLAKQRAPA